MVFNTQCEKPKTESGDSCLPYQRNLNGFCTNDQEKFRFHGMVDSAQVPYDRFYKTPLNLQSPRLISNYLVGDDNERNRPNKRHLTDLLTFMGQFLDHNLVFTGVSKSQPMPIRIPLDDPIGKDFENRNMNFMRSMRSCSPGDTRPINCLTSAIDLSGVYGPKLMRTNRLRKHRRGLLKFMRFKTGQKKVVYPPRYRYFNGETKMTIPHDNETHARNPKHTRNFFMVGDSRGNENRVLSSIHTMFLRNHNRLARLVRRRIPAHKIRAAFPEKRGSVLTLDEGIFQLAKRLNEATFQSIIVNEYYPAMTGRKLPSITYDNRVGPALTDVFTTVGFRVGHTLINNEIVLVNPDLSTSRRESIIGLFFENNAALLRDGVEPILRGAIWNKAQEIDLHIVEALRQTLFQFVRSEEMNRDLIALNLQRSRDHNIPSFSRLRELLGLPRPRSFADISKNKEVQLSLDAAYGSVDEVEAFPGLLAEDHAPGSPMGETLIRVWQRDFVTILKGDRFNFKGDAFHPLIKQYMGTELNAIKAGKRTLKSVIVANTDITWKELPKNLFINADARSR